MNRIGLRGPIFGLALLLASLRSTPAQTAPSAINTDPDRNVISNLLAQREKDENRIRDLETRLALVESQLENLVQQRAIPAASAALTEALPVTSAAPAPQPKRFEMPPELIPEIGKIGAEVGMLAAGSANPFQLDRGTFYGGYIDLPLLDRPAWLHGKIAYEIMVGLSRSSSKVTSTSNVAQVANLAVLTTLNPNGGLGNVADALAGTGAAPFPVTVASQLQLRLLQVVPFSFRYTSTAFDRWRLRPYGLLGFGTYVTIHTENATSSSLGLRAEANLPPAILQSLQQSLGGTSPFGSPLVAGQIGQSPELVARGLPGGNGNIEIGLQTGGGLEFRLTRTISLGFDARFNKISGRNGDFGTYGSRLGFHF